MAQLRLSNRGIFSLSSLLINNDMKRIYKKVFKSKKQSLGPIHGPAMPAISTSASAVATDHLMLSIPACESETTSAQAAAGVSVGVQVCPLVSSSIDLLLSNRPPIISESPPLFPLWRSVTVIFLLRL